MTDISPAVIKDLREKTGAGMMDCKKALAETKGNFEEAIDWLRKKGMAASAKKAGRTAAEGLIGIFSQGTKAAIIELNAETDFVSRNDKFQGLVQAIAEHALAAKGDINALNDFVCPKAGKKVSEVVAETVGTIGENLVLRRSDYVEVKDGVVSTYLHSAVNDKLGKIGVLVGLESTGDKAKLNVIGKQLAMHIAAARPESVSTDALDKNLIERERQIFSEQARASGKPDNIIEKMVDGRIRKFYEEVVLLEQPFIIDGKTKVSEVLKAAEKDVGAPIKVTRFARFALGEGIEKQASNFAEEVAAAAGMR
ncbi:MAG: elongation factor Ts [Proteobacteria bacterium]|nr:elongation factor Ts [Pseudomonadota bacterium]